MVIQWEQVSIGSSFEFKNGLNKGKEFFGQGTPIVNYTDVYKKRGLYKRDIQGKVTLTPEEIKRFKVEKNDVFFTRTSETPDEVGFSSVLLEEIENCVFSGFVLRAHPKNEEFYPLYCKYCFSTPDIREAISKTCTYTTRALTNGRQLSTIEILLPPLPEQQRIAEALSDVDALISSLEKLIAKKKAIKQGAMQELLTGKRRLPQFKERWVTQKLSSFADTASGGTPSRENPEYFTGYIPWVTTSELNDCYIEHTNEYVTEEAISHSSAKVFPCGTLLLAMYGATIGKLGILSIPAATNQACCAIWPRQNTDSKFLYYWFLNNREAIIEMGCGAGQPNISQAIIKNVSVCCPSKEEQIAIAAILSDMDIEIEALEQKLAKYRQVKQGMMQELLTGKIRLE